MHLTSESLEIASAVISVPLDTVKKVGHLATTPEAVRARFQVWMAFLTDLDSKGAALATRFECPEDVLRWYLVLHGAGRRSQAPLPQAPLLPDAFGPAA